MRESKQMLQIVRSEYQEIPGLRLTRRQIQRLWGLDAALCEAVIEALTDARFLLFRNGHYVRADVAP
jgi:hypothetical protein